MRRLAGLKIALNTIPETKSPTTAHQTFPVIAQIAAAAARPPIVIKIVQRVL
jgi:hypothetical protein